MKEKYLSLGGKIVLGSPVKKILIDKKSRIEKIIQMDTIDEKVQNLKDLHRDFIDGVHYKKIISKHADGVLFENGSTVL